MTQNIYIFLMAKLSLNDLSLQGKKALVRVDFNVPLDQEQQITDDTRIRACLPTLETILNQGGRPIVISHLGRPAGKKEEKESLAPVAKRLSELTGRKVLFAPDCIGAEAKKMANSLQPGEILLLENLRFHEAETDPEKDPGFAKALSELGDLYIDDAFGCAHRAHSSITELPKYFPGKAAGGLLMETEIHALSLLLNAPKRPFLALLGGAKLSSKLGVVAALQKKVDSLLIGGGMAFTFLKARGVAIGKSLCEESFITKAREIKAELPLDFVVAKEIKSGIETKIVSVEEGIPEGYMGLDIGPKTIALFTKKLQNAGTIFWNGPLGVFECPPFNKGTNAIAKAIVESKAITIVGGGDSISALRACGLEGKMTHVSTGGGASLEFLEFGTLPGIESLSSRI